MCSDVSFADARMHAEGACFQYCLKNDPWTFGLPGPTGILSPTGAMSAPQGVLHAAGPGVFRAYVPWAPEAVAESSDLHGLARFLTQATGSSTCWLSGPTEFFDTPATNPPPVPVVP
jgi:hypothetical protein